jgi:hypothetical protein
VKTNSPVADAASFVSTHDAFRVQKEDPSGDSLTYVNPHLAIPG